jgi:hypothetical protein
MEVNNMMRLPSISETIDFLMVLKEHAGAIKFFSLTKCCNEEIYKHACEMLKLIEEYEENFK